MFTLPNQYLARDVYNSFIDQEHFLVKLDSLLDWHDLATPLTEIAKNAHGGRPRYAPVLMLKMLFVSFLFNLSDRILKAKALNGPFSGPPLQTKATLEFELSSMFSPF